MLPPRMVLILLLTGAAVLALPVRAAAGLLNGSLGHWLDTVAAPQLAETLSRHPKFKGETVRFVALRNGKVMAAGNALTQAVEQRLTRHLLRSDGVRLAWREDAETCAAPQPVPYLLGIEIQAADARHHQLNLAMVDVQEGVWVSGVSLSWSGRLSSVELAALKRKVVSGRAGSPANPLPLAEGSRISEIIRAGLQCSVPGGLDGALFVATPTDPDLAVVSQSLRRALSIRPLAAVTPDRERARWVIRLDARSVGTGGQQLVATLHDTTEAGAAQQVASVFVTGLNQSIPNVPIATADGPTHHAHPSAALSGLLTRLSVHESARAGICATAQSPPRGCAEVRFVLLRPAYLLVLATEDQRLHSQTCGRSLRLADPGERRYRVRIGPTPGSAAERPAAGFYVLALENRELAQQIVDHLNRAPGACASTPDDTPLAGWLADLDAMLRQHVLEIEWRAMHLRRSSNGVVRL